MAINVAVTGNGHFKGSGTNLTSYSTSEDSTPINVNDSSGGTGQITFGVIEDATAEGTILLLNDTIELTDGSNGRTQGIVNSVSSTDSVAQITADSRLILLAATRTAAPFVGTLTNAFIYYLGLCGVTTGIVVDSTIASRSVTFPGFTGIVYDYLKQMCAAQQIEMSLVSSNIVLRPIRSRELEVAKNSTETYAVTNGQLAQTVEIYYYNNVQASGSLIYPPGGWNSNVDIIQVDAGQTLEQDIDVNVSMTSVTQPTPVSFVGPYDYSTSQYTVVGNDGLVIAPAQWTAGGGSVTVSINPDTTSLHIKIVGMTEPHYAPYQIAIASGTSNAYSTLRIVGAGVFFNKQKLTLPTGVETTKTAVIVGATVDNPFISTLNDAYTAGMLVAQSYASANQTINVTSTVVNRKGEGGFFNYPAFTVFDADFAGKTFAQFDTTYSGKTFAQFDADYQAKSLDTFANQAFGNVAGARVKYREAYYRVRSATITQDNIQYQAERDTTFADFDTANTGKTFGQFDTKFTGKAFADFGVIPLWT